METTYPNPCTRCGMCCLTEVCPILIDLIRVDPGPPCPMLSFDGDVASCDLVKGDMWRIVGGTRKTVEGVLGFGQGCCIKARAYKDGQEYDFASLPAELKVKAVRQVRERRRVMNEINGFETHMYEIYDDKKRPVISVCLMGRAGIWSRGIAFCCPKDYGVLRKADGRRRALHRCIQAAEKGIWFGPFCKETALEDLYDLAPEISARNGVDVDYVKGAWDVELTKDERDIVKNGRM